MTDEEMDEICDEINNLACKRQGLLLDKEENKAVTEKEQEISSRINELTDMLLETQTQTQTVQGVAREQKKTDGFMRLFQKNLQKKKFRNWSSNFRDTYIMHWKLMRMKRRREFRLFWIKRNISTI